MQVAGTPPAVVEQVLLVDLLLLRGQVLARIVDYERAAGLAEMLVRDALNDGAAWLARARTRDTLHRFAEALSDLDAARRCGADHAGVDAQRAAILRAVGCSTEALVLRQDAARRMPDLATLGALAVLQAERGEVTEAENLFTEARRRYRGVSSFRSPSSTTGVAWCGSASVTSPRPVPGSPPP
jgi:tetratricopeptide (TPR) repeat protein